MSLHTHTISRLLHQSLTEMMKSQPLQSFRLGDGTALSLQLGHRMSNEIDLYTDAPFKESDFERIKTYITATFGHGEHHQYEAKGTGTSFFVYNMNRDYVKVDLYYTNAFIRPEQQVESLRMAALEDIIAMKLEAIRKGGRKTDFWDLHELLQTHTLPEMVALHAERYPETHSKKELLAKLTYFDIADEEFDPGCLRKKDWDLMKLDLVDAV